MTKLAKLKRILKDMRSVLLAYSGGTDSTFLLKIASEVLKGDLLAVTAKSPTYPDAELDFSQKMADSLGVRHKIITTQEFKNQKFVANSRERCYFCKKELFSQLKKIAKQNNLKFVIDASNLTDKTDFRPGARAKKELGVRSPLEEAGFSKEDIRGVSRKLGLPSWDKPALACLASRVPYGTKLSRPLLKRIERGEAYLKKIGFTQVRLRTYDGLCRIEVEKKEIPKLMRSRTKIAVGLKPLGYEHITLDPEGYRTGSMNAR